MVISNDKDYEIIFIIKINIYESLITIQDSLFDMTKSNSKILDLLMKLKDHC